MILVKEIKCNKGNPLVHRPVHNHWATPARTSFTRIIQLNNFLIQFEFFKITLDFIYVDLSLLLSPLIFACLNKCFSISFPPADRLSSSVSPIQLTVAIISMPNK